MIKQEIDTLYTAINKNRFVLNELHKALLNEYDHLRRPEVMFGIGMQIYNMSSECCATMDKYNEFIEGKMESQLYF